MIEKVCTKCGAKWLFGNDNHNECPECDGKLRKKTNADRIRAMTDEELAETITEDWCSILCPGGSFFCDGECLNKMIEWLKQESE